VSDSSLEVAALGLEHCPLVAEIESLSGFGVEAVVSFLNARELELEGREALFYSVESRRLVALEVLDREIAHELALMRVLEEGAHAGAVFAEGLEGERLLSAMNEKGERVGQVGAKAEGLVKRLLVIHVLFSFTGY
jgi:hypothetical protein